MNITFELKTLNHFLELVYALKLAYNDLSNDIDNRDSLEILKTYLKQLFDINPIEYTDYIQSHFGDNDIFSELD